MLNSNIILSQLADNPKRIIIAYSGGLDSHVLLHLAASIPALKAKITAVHINHGLQSQADHWGLHCQQVCQDLGVSFLVKKVLVKRKPRQSLEECARDQRYQAFVTFLTKGDVILFAQHREDQMETVLLQLFRGAGIPGLSGMPWVTELGQGQLCRPFLDCCQQTLIDYAEQHHLNWIEDPSNQNNDFDRNFLRNQIIPQLKQRWSSLDKTISRSARHCANHQALIQTLIKPLFQQVYQPEDNTLDCLILLDYPLSQQALIIRQWFSQLGLKMPSEKRLQAIINNVLMASPDANPEFSGSGYCIRRYRHKLYYLTDHNSAPPSPTTWETGKQSIALGNQQLTLLPSTQGIAQTTWQPASIQVRFRQGTEKIRLPGRTGHHSLKKLFQESAIPPWERPHIPLIYLDNQLAAIADLWISADFYTDQADRCYQLVWYKDKALSLKRGNH